MGELIPVAGGLAVGAPLALMTARGTRLGLMLGTSLVIAIFAGLVNGELTKSIWFLAIDFPLALAAEAAAAATVLWLRARRVGREPIV